MATVVAYVDGFNLYYGMKAKHARRYMWLDVIALTRHLRPADQVVAVRYFTAVVQGEPAAAANQMDYLRALEAHGGSVLDVRRGWFKTRSIGLCPRCREHWKCACQLRFRSYEEKGTDVALGASMVEDAALQLADITLLISADSDFAPAVAAVQRIAPTRQVFLAMPPGNLQPNKRFSNVGHFNINETALRNSQLPDTVINQVTGATYKRPSKWI